MNSYGNPIVTYDEIVEALKAILDCSKNNGYLDEYSFLNAKYDTLKNNPLQVEQEKALIKAIQSLEKTIDTANKMIKENLEREISEINATNIFSIPTQYKQTKEARKLASQDELIAKLQEMSLPLEVLSQPSSEENDEEKTDMFEEVDNIFEEVEDVIEEKEVESIADEAKIEEPKSSKENDKIDIMSMELPDFSLEKITDEKQDDEDMLEKIKTVKKEKVEEEVSEEKAEKPIDKKIDTSKVELIKKALEKAREKENEQLVKILEQQLIKEIEALKS